MNIFYNYGKITTDKGEDMDKKKFSNEWVFLFIVIAMAVVLRFVYIDIPLWYDEACSWFTAIQKFPFGIIDNLLTLDLQHTPLYFFALHFWMKMFGDTEVMLRVFSLIFGVGTVPLVYFFAKKISTKQIAIISTGLATVSPLLVFFSTEVRMYPMVVFLVMLSLNYLVDFEQKNDIKSLLKLTTANVLIPYTFVGGIFYNIALLFSYGVYLGLNNREKFNKYIKFVIGEFVLLIPYFVLIAYYAKMRSVFVVSHEGPLNFVTLVDMVRNFFGSTITDNIYWPATSPYLFTFSFTMLVVLPCCYFVYGYIQCLKKSEKFEKVLTYTILSALVLAIVFAYFKVNIFTVRYILYLLPPMLILSTIGLSKKISPIHLKIFVALFILCSCRFDFTHASVEKILKTNAFKAVSLEASKFNLESYDIVIMPFGSDAPYYFKAERGPQVYNFDFHKEVRNPYNKNYYDEYQRDMMANSSRYGVIYDSIFADKGFSDAHFEYFMQNVNNKVPKGRYVLLALYGDDASQLVQLQDLRKSVTSIEDIKNNTLSIMLEKYLIDVRAYLDSQFNYLGSETVGNYTYLLYQKR